MYIVKCIPVMQSWISTIITPVFSVTWSFRNHSNMLICCSRNISYYYQCWKQFLMLNIFVETVILYHSDVWGKKRDRTWYFDSAKMHWIDQWQ